MDKKEALSYARQYGSNDRHTGPDQRASLMGWVRVSDDFYDHPKFIAVGPIGVALWTTAMAYCNRNLTDGYMPKARARGLLDLTGIHVTRFENDLFGIDDEPWPVASQLLIASGLWHEDGHDCDRCPQPGPGYYYVHDYLAYQPSKAEVEELRRVRAEAGRKGGQAKAKQVASQDAKQTAQQNAGKTLPPIPSPKSQETSSKTSIDPSSPVGGVGEATDEVIHRARLFGFDPDRVRQELTKALGEFPGDDMVMAVGVGILGRAKSVPRDATAYIVGAIRQHPQEAGQLAYGGAA